jgi:hypothetical protein
MTAVVRSTAVGIFENHDRAEEAVNALRRAGFPEEQIGFVARNLATPREGAPTDTREHHVAEGAAAGAVGGGAIGTIAGLAVAAGLIPPLGPVVAGGFLVGLLASAAAGVAVGGAVGGLAGLGIPQEDAGAYEKDLEAGRTMVTVKADGRYDEAVRLLRQFGAMGKGSPLV